MEKTNVITTSPNIEGNIGSCEVKKVSYSVDSWHTGVILQNSCDGTIVARHEYYDWSYIYFPFIIIFTVVSVIFLVGRLTDY